MKVKMERKVSLGCQGNKKRNKVTYKCGFCSSFSAALSESYFPQLCYIVVVCGTTFFAVPDRLAEGLSLSSVYLSKNWILEYVWYIFNKY